MNLRFSEWFLALNLVSIIYVLSLDISLGFFYSFASAGVAIPVYFGARIKNQRKQVCFLLLGFLVWITYLLRPLVLIPNPELFTYVALLGEPSREVMQIALIKTGVCSVCLLSGLYAGLSIINPFSKKRKKKKKRQAATDQNPLVRTIKKEDVFLYKNKSKITLIIAGLACIDAIAKLVLKIGLKTQFSEGPSSLNAILLIILPQFLIYSFISILILKYKVKSKPLIASLIVFFLLDLISGSKGAFAEIAIMLFSVYIFLNGNKKAKSSAVLLALAISTFAMFLTFTIANTIRFSASGYDGQLIALITDSISNSISVDAIVELSNSVTGRFIGFDGLIATEIYQTPLLAEVFDFLNTISRVISKVNPLDGGGGSITSGKALGLVYFALDEDFSFAGAVGVFGALQLMAGSTYLYAASIGAGFFYSGLFNLSSRFKSSDFSMSFFCLVILMITRSVMSGNFDLSLSSFIINIFSLFFYWFIISIL